MQESMLRRTVHASRLAQWILVAGGFALAACGGTDGPNPPSDAAAGVGGGSGASTGGTGSADGVGGSPSATGGVTSSGGASGGASSGGSEGGGTGGAGGSSGGETSGGGTGGASGGTGGAPGDRLMTATKLDLLFVIDNSVSMADKQALLVDAVPGLLLDRLADPPCLDGNGTAVPATNGQCPSGFQRAHTPLTDVRIGVTTSSLGDHGGNLCNPDRGNPTQNDRAHLLPTVRTGLTSSNAAGYVAWNGQDGSSSFDATALLQDHVAAAGEIGCGFEAPLEAWYRFLVDPSPPIDLEVDGSRAVSTGVDQEVLAQRAAFLRPDSAVMIVMLTDENDCSVMEGGGYYPNAEFSWLTGTSDPNGFRKFPLASDECATDPNSECCYSCLASDRPAGCSNPCDEARPAELDRPNLRCFDQKRRFGIDLLYPVQRYIDGLTQTYVPDTRHPDCSLGDCPLVENPLFAEVDGKRRSPSMIILLGIVGVPWQDIATSPSLADPTRLEFLSSTELDALGRWDVILGDPENGVLASDPLMHEAYTERTGTNPITGDALVPSTSQDPQANPINGHEFDNSLPSLDVPGDGLPMNDDLQFACIFPLEAPRDCRAVANLASCDCATTDDVAKNKPLCQDPETGVSGHIQRYAKAYPGLRHLQVLRGLGSSGVVASICPKNPSGDPADVNFGYNPAMQAGHRALSSALE